MSDKKTHVKDESPDSNMGRSNTNSTSRKSDINMVFETGSAFSSPLSSSPPFSSISSDQPIIESEIQDIEGIGPTTAKKLKEAGIVSVMDLAVTSAEELAVEINASKDSAATFIIAVRSAEGF